MTTQTPPTQTHRRNSSSGSSTSYTSPTTTGHSNNDHTMPAVYRDPLTALERDLLAHPTTHHYAHGHHHYQHHPHHQQHTHQQAHLAPPPSSAHDSRSRTPSPAPSPAAQRCMAATAAWKPSLDRRQSWDGQEYRRAMMLQATGLVCGCHPGDGAPDTQEHHDHRDQSGGQARGIYESDRGFSEVVGSVPHV